YPRWQDFLRVRATLDPQGVFLNDYLRRLLGVEAATAASGSAGHAPTTTDGATGAL
ncbi:MAG TPA: D-arabinono-1,4-lactone oxidase, partial [Ktedonobacterales bacterium]